MEFCLLPTGAIARIYYPQITRRFSRSVYLRLIAPFFEAKLLKDNPENKKVRCNESCGKSQGLSVELAKFAGTIALEDDSNNSENLHVNFHFEFLALQKLLKGF